MDYSPRLAGFELTTVIYLKGDFSPFSLVEQLDALLGGGQALVLAGILEFLPPALRFLNANAIVFNHDPDAFATFGPKANAGVLWVRCQGASRARWHFLQRVGATS